MPSRYDDAGNPDQSQPIDDWFTHNAPQAAAEAPTTVSPTDTPDQRRQTIIDQIVRPAYQSTLGRAPTDAELADGVDRYERGGGDDFRSWLQTRASPENTANDFGGPPAAFGEQYSTPEVPEWLRTPYVAPTWQGGDFAAPAKPTSLLSEFAPPTMAEVMASPGYATRLATGLQSRNRSAAAQGSVLSGGTQKALERYGQDYGSEEYGAETARRLATRQQAVGEYNTDYGNAFDQYLQRYGQFRDSASLGLSARQQNENEYQNTVGNSLNQFNTRYGAYQGGVTNTRNAELDWWSRQQDLIQNDLASRALARP